LVREDLKILRHLLGEVIHEFEQNFEGILGSTDFGNFEIFKLADNIVEKLISRERRL
jgi:hypothetical protein